MGSDPLAYKQYWNQFSGSQGNQKEIATYDGLMREYASIKGVPVEYFTINVDDYKDGMDQVYGENSTPKWDKKYTLVAILEDFTPEANQFSGIGLENIDEAVFYVHRGMFDEIIGIRTNKQTNKSRERRGAYGPVASDQIRTLHNGLIYDVMTGGLHFLSSEAQQFGHKFWYKLTCKIRQVSDAPLGTGEQYGAVPDLPLDPKWKGNPQFLIPNPTRADWENQTGTPIIVQPITPPGSGCPTPPAYQTIGTAIGSPTSSPPEDLIDPNTNTVKEIYQGAGLAPGSIFGDNADVEKEAAQIVNPDTDKKVDPDSPDGKKFGPDGRIIHNPANKELFGDW